MYKSIAASAVALGLVISPAVAGIAAAAPVVAVQEGFTIDSSLYELLNNEAAFAVLEKHIPDVVEQIEPYADQIPPEMTLAELEDYGLVIDDETKAAMDAELKAL